MTSAEPRAGHLTRLLDSISRVAVVLVVVATLLGFAAAPVIRGTTQWVVPIALILLVFTVASATAVPSFASLARTVRWAVPAVVVPAALLPIAAWMASKLVDGPAADGVLALGLAPAEVASVATVSIAAGDAVLAATTLAGSILVTTIAGPLVLGGLAGRAGEIDVLPLIGGLVLEVVLPFVTGLLAGPSIRRRVDSSDFDGLAVVIVCILAAVTASQLPGLSELPRLALAAGVVVVVGYLIGIGLGWRADAAARRALWLTCGMRDFAVAAALSTAVFGPAAAAPAAVFGVLVLVSGTAVAVRQRGS
jgi:BASS family bile acid:Na+ symporter